MTSLNDRNSLIRAKNLFEEETSEEDGSGNEIEKKDIQGVQSSVGDAENSAGHENPVLDKNLAGGEKPALDKNSAGGEKPALDKNFAGHENPVLEKNSEYKKIEKKKDTVAATKQPDTSAKVKSKAKKSPRQKQAAYRLYVCAAMAVFVLFVMGWGICQGVLAINRAENQSAMIAQPGEKIVDNSANAGKSMDVDKLVEKVLDNVTFEAELNLLSDSVASGMIDTAEGTDLRIYMGNGTYSDEFVVMTASSEQDAEQNQKNAEKHLADMQKQFKDYIPKEAKKIDNAIKVRCGSYVVVCVTNDTDTAKKTIDTFIKNIGND